MYLEFYHLREYPFSLASDPRFLYYSAAHQEAMAALLYSLRERKGVSLLLGEPGTGKTTLLNAVMEMLPGGVVARWLDSPLHATPAEALAAILTGYGVELDTPAGGLSPLLARLRQYLLERHAAGEWVLLVIDEAQDLNPLVLEQVRLLSNLETGGQKLLQIILSGQPELGHHLHLANGRALHQRVAVGCRLQPLSLAETRAYVRARLEHAGATSPLFEEDAVARMHNLARGIPRVLNVVADHCLLAGFAVQSPRIGGAIMARVEEQLAPELDLPGGARTAAAPVREAPPSAPQAPAEPARRLHAEPLVSVGRRPPVLQRFASGWARWAGLSPREGK
ncbi:MAG: ExeA family protein [Terriglobales bacterium]